MTLDMTKKHHYYFEQISQIPRGSRNEKAISDYIVSFAQEHGFKYKQDHVWNVIVYKPASAGYENSAPLVLQAHIDMVNEKNKDSDHDFTKDPLDLYIDEEGWLHARGTTLGADDGYGVSYMLSILDDDTLAHPELCCVFTTMEEIGLLGAKELKAEDIRGKRLINLDGGGENATTVSSAGGASVDISRTFGYEDNTSPAYRLEIRGLLGGHSGGLIHTEKGNSIMLGFRILKELVLQGIDLRIAEANGGLKYNAIPRESDFVFASDADPAQIENAVSTLNEKIKEELRYSDAGFNASLQSAKAEKVLSHKDTEEILNFFYLAPNGFKHRSMAIEGLTTASLNMGVMTLCDGRLEAKYLVRCALTSHTDLLLHQLSVLGDMTHVEVVCADRIPGWNYEADSELRKIAAEVLEKHGVKLETRATHGGLETGVFKGIIPDMDIITFGPQSSGAHTPDEKLNIASWDRTLERLKEIISACR